jgi:glucose-fructose oxidoreductase
MKRILMLVVLLGMGGSAFAAGPVTLPMKVGIVGLVHDHVGSFLGGGALVPAGSILKRPDIELVGIVEPDQKLFDKYAKRFHLAPELRFDTVQQMVAKTHPRACLLFTAASDHRRYVEECAALGLDVLMEKPLAFKYSDAVAMERAAAKAHIHVLVDYETSWYDSNATAIDMLKKGELGAMVKTVAEGPGEGRRRRADRFWLLRAGPGDMDDGGRSA